MDILVHRHVKIPQYKIQVKYNIKAVYEYKMYLINTKQGKRITFSALKIAPKELFRKFVRGRLHTRIHLIVRAGQLSGAHAIPNIGNRWQYPKGTCLNTMNISQHLDCDKYIHDCMVK